MELKGVCLDRRRPLLADIDWAVERGQHWAVLGRNGAGKTLLLKIIAGYMWPSRGDVKVLSESFGRVDLRELRQDIGWVSSALSEKIPIWDSALEVILSGAFATFGLYRLAPPELVDQAQTLMADLGLAGLQDQRFEKLSAGEKQRVLLARARLAGPRLLILDEPCAGLDLAAREKFLRLVDRLADQPDGPTMLMVTHRVSEISPAFTHGLLLKRGRILAAGHLEQVLTDDLMSEAMEIKVKITNNQGRWQAQAAAGGQNEKGGTA